MNIDKVVEIACEHFLQKLQPGSDIYQLLLHYANEELELKEDDASEFAMASLKGLKVESEDKAQEFYKFYIWYYVNYVVPPDPQA